MKYLFITIISLLFCTMSMSQTNYESYTLSINCWMCGNVKITIEKKNDSLKLDYLFAHRIERPDGSLIIDTSKTITADEWKGFKDIIEKGNFWKFPESTPGDIAEDGADWLLEGHIPGDGYSFSGWVPHRNTLLYEAGAYLVNLTGMDRLKKLIDEASRE